MTLDVWPTELEKTNQQLIDSKQALESQKANLIESERKYRILAENVSDIIWIMDLKTRKFVYISPSVEKIQGIHSGRGQSADT
jgi:PAS domain-containing protein